MKANKGLLSERQTVKEGERERVCVGERQSESQETWRKFNDPQIDLALKQSQLPALFKALAISLYICVLSARRYISLLTHLV